MEKVKQVEDLLTQYTFYKARKTILERRKAFLVKVFDEGLLTEDMLIGKDEITNELNNIEKELPAIEYLIEKVDLTLEMISSYNEKYKLMIESFFIKKIRMEDISELMHISRSSCYDLKHKAVNYMADIIFGNH